MSKIPIGVYTILGFLILLIISVIYTNKSLMNPIPFSDKACMPPIQVVSGDYKDNNIKYLSTQISQLCTLMSKGN